MEEKREEALTVVGETYEQTIQKSTDALEHEMDTFEEGEDFFQRRLRKSLQTELREREAKIAKQEGKEALDVVDGILKIIPLPTVLTSLDHFRNLYNQHTATQNLHELGKYKIFMERGVNLDSVIDADDPTTRSSMWMLDNRTELGPVFGGGMFRAPDDFRGFSLGAYENFFQQRLQQAESFVQSMNHTPNLHSAYTTAIEQTRALISQVRESRERFILNQQQMQELQDIEADIDPAELFA